MTLNADHFALALVVHLQFMGYRLISIFHENKVQIGLRMKAKVNEARPNFQQTHKYYKHACLYTKKHEVYSIYISVST